MDNDKLIQMLILVTVSINLLVKGDLIGATKTAEYENLNFR